MAHTSIPLLPNIPMALSATTTSFVSSWGDKRSGTTVGLSLVFYGGTPDGYATVEISNAIVEPGTGYGAPINNGDDATTLTGSQTNVALNPITGLYQVTWQLANLPARFVRVRYVAATNKSGLSANIYMAVPHESA